MNSMAPPAEDEDDAFRRLPDILTVDEMAAFLRVDKSTIRNRMSDGSLKSFNIKPGGGSGTAYRSTKAQFLDFIKKSGTVPKPRRKRKGRASESAEEPNQ